MENETQEIKRRGRKSYESEIRTLREELEKLQAQMNVQSQVKQAEATKDNILALAVDPRDVRSEKKREFFKNIKKEVESLGIEKIPTAKGYKLREIKRVWWIYPDGTRMKGNLWKVHVGHEDIGNYDKHGKREALEWRNSKAASILPKDKVA